MKLGTAFLTIFCFCFHFSVAAQQSKKQRVSQRKRNEVKRGGPTVLPSAEYLTADKTRPLPFSDAVRVGHMLYLSGQIGADRSLALVPGGIKAETKQAMENIRSILERNGSALDQVVKCTVMLADMSEWGAMNDVYTGYFPKQRLPARSAFGANGLARGARVEIECWATVK